jgi:hypothetical protein
LKNQQAWGTRKFKTNGSATGVVADHPLVEPVAEVPRAHFKYAVLLAFQLYLPVGREILHVTDEGVSIAAKKCH